MKNVMRQAQLMFEGETEFLHWLQGLVDGVVPGGVVMSGEVVEDAEWYSTSQVFASLFGHAQRIYQAWERREDFPVKEPERRYVRRCPGRAYSPTDVCLIAWWIWNRKERR